MAEFRSQRSIALLAGNGAIALVAGQMLVDHLKNYSILPPIGMIATGLVLASSAYGAFCAYQSFEYAGDKTGDPTKYNDLEKQALRPIRLAVVALVLMGVGFGVFYLVAGIDRSAPRDVSAASSVPDPGPGVETLPDASTLQPNLTHEESRTQNSNDH